tara:strand:- start:6570 stop:8693 length:2124 start_codon:yes stop_codon:yes gene_type:complete
MTVIRPNGISGVTSITSSGDAINFYRSDGTLGPELGINVNVTSGVSTFAALNVTGVLTYEDVASVDSVGIITARSTIDAKGDISIADKIIHTGDTNTAIRFPAADTITAETSGSERVRINSSGDLYIGGTSGLLGKVSVLSSGTTDTSLHLATSGGSSDNGDATNTIRFTGGTNSRWANAKYEAFAHIFHSNGAERARLTATGNFGVGTNSPATPLVVSNSGAEGWELGYTSGTVELVGYNRSGSARSPMKIIGQTFLVQTGNPSLSNGLYQDANGKVLIGTQTTSSYADRLLTVGNTSHTSPTIEIRSATNGQPGLVFSDSTAGDVNSYRGTIEYNHASNYMMFRTDAVERMRITSAGNFGIGTQSPLVRFVVSDGAIRNIEMGYSSGLTNNYIQSYNRSTSAYMGLTIAASPISFQIGSTEAMKIDSSGNVGINESSPSSYAGSGHQLVVSDVSSACGMTIRTSSSHSGNIFFSDGTSGTQRAEGYMQYNHAGNYLAFGTLNTERMRISSTGTILNGNSIINDNTNGAGEKLTGGGFVAVQNDTVSSGLSGFQLKTGSPTKTLRMQIMLDGDLQNANNSYTGISDIKLKENIVDANSQWDDIKSIKVRNYNFKPETNLDTHKQIGLIAQELETVCPGLVGESPDRDENDNDLGTVTKSVNYSVLYMKTVKALQEAMDRIETLETQNTSQQTQIDDLITRVTALEG